MGNFDLAYKLILNNEGGYSNNPSDKGGETWKGIARNRWPNWKGWALVDLIRTNCGSSQSTFLNALAMDNELELLVRKFYQEEFWNRMQLDQISNQVIVTEIFDTAVNQGMIWAVKYFQEALNMLNNNQKYYPDIIIDGKLGKETLKSLDAYMLTAYSVKGRNEAMNVKVLLKAMDGLQFERYKEIVNHDPTQEVFFYGWIQRT